jgi:hypothetical protein
MANPGGDQVRSNWQERSALGKAVIAVGVAIFIVVVGYLLLTFTLIGLGNLGFGDS